MSHRSYVPYNAGTSSGDSQRWLQYFKPPPAERGNSINSVYPGEDVDDAEDEIAPDYKIPDGDIADIDWFAKNHQRNSFSVPFRPDSNVSDNNQIPDIQLNYPFLSYSTHNPLPSSNLNSGYTCQQLYREQTQQATNL